MKKVQLVWCAKEAQLLMRYTITIKTFFRKAWSWPKLIIRPIKFQGKDNTDQKTRSMNILQGNVWRFCDEVLSQKCIYYMKMILLILSGKMKTMQIPFKEPVHLSLEKLMLKVILSVFFHHLSLVLHLLTSKNENIVKAKHYVATNIKQLRMSKP